jgi:hypothetical protein
LKVELVVVYFYFRDLELGESGWELFVEVILLFEELEDATECVDCS